MPKIDFSVSAPFILSLAATLIGCGSDASPSPTTSTAGADSGGSTAAAGADSGEGGANTAGANAAGANAAGANAGGAPSAIGPCVYTVSGGESFPKGDAMYLCSGGSRVLQQMGKGDFDVVVGAAFSTADKHISTIACSLTSKDPPAAGDVWELGTDHPGNCQLSDSQGSTAHMWATTSNTAGPGTGSASVKFLSATLMQGKYVPEDVYYLFEVEISSTLPGLTADTPEVTLTGTFNITTLPLGA